MDQENISGKRIRLLRNIARIFALFALLVSVLIILNYVQSKRSDPLNSKALVILNERLSVNPADDQLRTEIRQLDLLARKAYFTSRWQVRTGGILLFGSIIIILICLQAVELLRKKIPVRPDQTAEDFFAGKTLKRNWVIATGGFIITAAFILTFLSHQDLKDEISRQTVTNGLPGDEKPDTKMAAGTKPADTLLNSGDQPGEQSQNEFATDDEFRANYAGFRGYHGLGIILQRNIPVDWDGATGRNIKWKTSIPLPGYNSPVFWNGKIFLSGANDKKREVYCIDAASGKITWKVSVADIPGSPAQAPKVNRETGFCAPTLTTDGRRVYAIFANGDLAALDFSGNVVWSKNMGLPKNHYGHSSSLLTWHDILIVQFDQSGDAFVAGLSGKTGDVIWKTRRNVKVSWASPVLINTGKRSEIILAAEPFLAGYDPSSGTELWKMDCIGGEVGPSPAYAGGIVFSVNEYSKLAAVQLGDNPKQLWEDTEFLSDVPSPVAYGNYLFLSTSYGTMVCYDSKTGEKYWTQETGNNMYASPVIAGGNIYQLDSKGVMHIISADKVYHPVADLALGEGSFCTPAFAEGKIFIRGDRNLYCIGK